MIYNTGGLVLFTLFTIMILTAVNIAVFMTTGSGHFVVTMFTAAALIGCVILWDSHLNLDI